MNSESQTPDQAQAALQESDQDPVCREVVTADAEQVLALQNRSFGTKRTLVDWNWKNVDNPYLQNAAVVGVIGDKVISSYQVVGMKLNMLGSPVLVSQPTDTVIDTTFRGKRHFQHLLDYAVRFTQRIGCQAGMGFPNEQAIRPNLHREGLSPLAVLNTFSQRLCLQLKSPSSITSSILAVAFRLFIQGRIKTRSIQLGIALGPTVKIALGDRLPDAYEEFWNTMRKRETVSFWKDSQYMQWRYEKNPRRNEKYFSAIKKDILCGLAVVVRRRNISYITELMIPDHDVELAKLLVNRILQDALENGVEIVKFFGHDRGFFALVFSDFSRQPSEDLMFVARFESDLLRELCLQPINLCLTAGDADIAW